MSCRVPSTLVARELSSPRLKETVAAAVHDLVDPLRDLVALASDTEARARDVAAHRYDALRIAMTVAEQLQERPLHARSRLAVALGPHERKDPAVGEV